MMMMRLLGFVCLVNCSPAANTVAMQLPNVFSTEKGGFRLAWAIDGDVAEFELSLNGSAYVACGFGAGMLNADMVIAWVDKGGKANANDYWSSGHAPPALDTALGGTEDVTVLSGSLSAGRTTVRFRRKLVTGDKYDRPLSATGANAITDVVYAWADGEPGAVQYHGDNHNHIQIDLSQPDGVARNSTFGREEAGGGARRLVTAARQATLVTLQTERSAGAFGFSGWPYGSVADYADDGTGRPLLLLWVARGSNWARPTDGSSLPSALHGLLRFVLADWIETCARS